MSSPSLKIKLRLSGPKPVSETPSPTTSLIKNVNIKEDESPSSPRKRMKPNTNRSRKPKTEESSVPDTPQDDDNGDETPNSNSRRGPGPGAQINGNAQAIRELLRYKHIKPRKWETKPLAFYTLTGSEIQVASWQSEGKMKLNQKRTEPRSIAEIDQIFSATSTEKDFRPFLCTQPGCSKAFTSYDQLQTHETNIHGAKKLVCGIDGCHKSFATSGQLTKHQKMVHFRAARKAKLAAAAAAETTVLGDNLDKDEDVSTPSALNGGDNDSLDISNL